MKFYLQDPQGLHTSLLSDCCSGFALDEDRSNHLGSAVTDHLQSLPPHGHLVGGRSGGAQKAKDHIMQNTDNLSNYNLHL